MTDTRGNTITVIFFGILQRIHESRITAKILGFIETVMVPHDQAFK
jgi:hypothetical protein